MEWYIGCSGFYYPEWKEIFYPKGLPQKEWFKYYCTHFNTIEINSTFYKLPSEKSLHKWHTESPTDFLFTCKAPRLITHYKQLVDCKALMQDFYQLISAGLKEKLGCILLQFPPKFTYTEARLELLLNNLDNRFKNAVEFRHSSWWRSDVYQQLAQNHLIFCGQSYPSDLPDLVIQNTSDIYYRFHGKPVLYKSAYSTATLTDFKKAIPEVTKQVFVYFNNTWGTAALQNAQELRQLI